MSDTPNTPSSSRRQVLKVGNDMDTYAADVAALVTHLKLKNAVHIGHSTGGGEVAQTLITRYPSLNVLVNNAGIMPFDDAAGHIDDETMLATLTSHFMGPVRLTSALIEHLKSQPRSVIINNTFGCVH